MEENNQPIKPEEKAESKPEQPTVKKEEHPKFVWTWKSAFFSFAWLGVLMFGIDLLSKWLVVWNLGVTSNQRYEVIPGFFYIWPLTNLGSAYGAGGDNPAMRYVFIVISWAASIAIPYFWCKQLYKHAKYLREV